MGRFDRRVNMAGKARLGFGIRAKLGRGSPFVGGAYIYIDPTPSKNVFKANIDVDHVSGCTTPAMGCAPCLAGGGPWDERRPAPYAGAGARPWGPLAHAWGIMALPYALTAICPDIPWTSGGTTYPPAVCPAWQPGQSWTNPDKPRQRMSENRTKHD
jgi:hypothetical protein